MAVYNSQLDLSQQQGHHAGIHRPITGRPITSSTAADLSDLGYAPSSSDKKPGWKQHITDCGQSELSIGGAHGMPAGFNQLMANNGQWIGAASGIRGKWRVVCLLSRKEMI